jgi:hypothetical protein
MSAEQLAGPLPEHRAIQRRSEADYYGASGLIAAALGLAAAPRSTASWKHGVSYARELAYPEVMLTEGNRLTRHLVTDVVQAEQLRARGYLRTHAVGAPYLYVPPPVLDRVPRSLLVMPAHSLVNSKHRFDEAEYADQISSLRGCFDIILACVSSPCVRAGRWTRAFEERRIPWIAGADSHDGNALPRMATLFARFECITSNYLGSYVAYAAYSGCQVSLWGRFADPRLEDFKGIPWYEKNWRKVADVFEQSTESSLRQALPWLFRNPWEARPNRDWAERILGLRHRRTPSEIARLLGWTALGRAELLLQDGARFSRRATLAAMRRLAGAHPPARRDG